jgi:beta-1,2-mannobiose phosphorylase / 1,2-beta-oligomannan phosphorylase
VYFQKRSEADTLLHRIEPDMCIAFSDDLVKWCDVMSVMKPRVDGWDNWKIGVSGTPIKINEGWLVIYHGISVEDVFIGYLFA